jgi:hypothetical protein
VQLNTLYKRNTNPNLYIDQEDYQNCGSYALGVDRWYCPYLEIDEDVSNDDELWQYTEYERTNYVTELVLEGFDREEIMERLIERDFEFILKTCPWLVPIDEDEISENDRVIAYRLSMEIPDEREEFDMDEDTDFHFRLFINGEWWEKNGASPVHKVVDSDSDIWEVDEWLIYDGEIRYAKFREEI